jgi:hypothetical protein
MSREKTPAMETSMTRLALAAASLVVGLAAVSPVQAIDLSRFADFDPEDVEISELAPEIRRMVRTPSRATQAMRDLKEALGDEEEFATVRQLLNEATGEPKAKRMMPSQPRATVASSKAVKQNVKEVKAPEPATAGSGAAGGQTSSRSVNCTKFVPYASTTIPMDCE